MVFYFNITFSVYIQFLMIILAVMLVVDQRSKNTHRAGHQSLHQKTKQMKIGSKNTCRGAGPAHYGRTYVNKKSIRPPPIGRAPPHMCLQFAAADVPSRGCEWTHFPLNVTIEIHSEKAKGKVSIRTHRMVLSVHGVRQGYLCK